MVKTKQKLTEPDSTYFLKLVMFVILGSLWLKFNEPITLIGDFQLIGLPVGLIVGLLFASQDHFQVDRKIEYAILVVMSAVTLYLPIGIIL